MTKSSDPVRVALAQIPARLGEVEGNLDAHLRIAERAAREGARLVLFPELSLTGYELRDLTPDVALRPSPDDPRFARLLEASREISIAVGFVEEAESHLFHNSAAYLESGRVVHVHRKVHLPTYGMFDEGRRSEERRVGKECRL